ncbi:hypothetical protein GUITHDRAFT_102460 [Guillardia theta CCMP2712]|uniref:Uncharacterized protein n=1 Tax=Guillardia theta (strain CCMP2712) TaxID=905079 RepID=L1JUU1_GUITC|nr:hypothetical protein GUITHDRAFT_102460 [Guillardia theta CCMP2712]EKX51848.1 hypothetical protein GUITHDRAFT_102460 [Guillardia theta CCMP2712]|eukprot:XP_005838828.1 hypothetical protein GUITHDRAFT_102460 [Guillardia theta CCMP2712]
MLNEAGLQSVIDTVGDPRSRRQVPSHPHGRKMKGDIHIPGIRDRGSADLTKWGEVNLDALHVAASEKIRKHRAAYAMTTPPRAFIPLAISTDGTLHPDTLRFIWYLADIIAQRSMPLEDAAFGRHFVPDDGPAAEVLARKRAATYQRLTMQLTLEALLSGARRMTPLQAQALLEPEDSSSSDFVESPEESSPEVSDSDGGHPSSGPDDRRGAGEASPSLTVTSGASGELDTTGVLAAGPSSPASSPASVGHTAHSEKLHNHTQNTSPKRTSTAGTQTRHRQPKREAAQTSKQQAADVTVRDGDASPAPRRSSGPLEGCPPSESETSGEDSSGDSTKSEEELSSGSRSACACKGVMRLAPDKSASSVSCMVRR